MNSQPGVLPNQSSPWPQNKFLRRPEWIAAGLITAAIVALHLFFLFHAGGFWRDEVNLINLAKSHSLADMKKDSFPILMPLLVRFWTRLGFAQNDLSLRILGTLIGLGIPAAFWWAAWKIRRLPPFLSLALFCLNSTLIFFGDSIRAYGLGSLLIILTATHAVIFLRQPSWRRTIWLTLSAVLSVQTLYHNTILVGAICLGAWAVCWRKKNRLAAAQVFLAGFIAALSLSPYVTGIIAGRAASSVLISGLKSWRFIAAFHDSLGFPFPIYFYAWAILSIVIIILAFITLFLPPKISTPSANDLSLFAGTTLLAAVLGFILFLWLAAFPAQSWYLLPLMALIAVCFEIGLPEWRGKMRAIFFGLVAATALIALPTASRDLHHRFTNVDLWAKDLTTAAAPEDYVVVVPWLYGITFDHYFTGPAAWTTLPPLADHSVHRYDLVKLQIQNTNAIQPVLEKILTTLQSGHRVWILAAMGWMDIPDAGTVAPASLPPAPLKNSGWSEAPYTLVWSSQAAHLLGDHALQFSRVKNSAAGMQVIENMELFMAEGWKNSSAPAKSNAAQP
ncbi:MAG TPA: hypothetical protein VIK59_11300 [Verrucomicrobiae bacterium]